jgi:hypothetical protein
MNTIKGSFGRLSFPVATILLLAVCVVSVRATPAGQKTPNVSGNWSWNGKTIILGPDELIMAFFGIPESEGPVMRLICDTWGTMTLTQSGTSFSGVADQDGSCTTAGEQSASTTPFPPFFSIDGSVTGHAVHFDGDVGEGIVCPYQGSLDVQDGLATQLNATGRCVVPFPAHPLLDKELEFNATRP